LGCIIWQMDQALLPSSGRNFWAVQSRAGGLLEAVSNGQRAQVIAWRADQVNADRQSSVARRSPALLFADDRRREGA
jgi:hypothetical protein